MMNKRIIIATGFCILAAFVGIAAAFLTLSPTPSQLLKQQKLSAINLTGFAPYVDVDYKVITPEATLINKQGRTNKDGHLSFSYDPQKTKSHENLIYDVHVKDPHDTLSILLRVNNQTGRIEASGSGVEEFSDIIITTSDGEVRAYSDWAGIFKEKMTRGLFANEDNQIQVALYGAGNFLYPGQTQSPAVIQVLDAPGGGGPTYLGVNNLPITDEQAAADIAQGIPIIRPSPSPLSTSNRAALQAEINAIENNYVQALMAMTEQLTAVGLQQVGIIGSFFDAKQQLETQRTHQELKAEAVKDYHPSEEMCKIGSYMRSISATEQKAQFDKRVLNEILMSRTMNEYSASTSEGYAMDADARLRQFRTTYCDVRDNNYGLAWMCDHDQDAMGAGEQGATDPMRVNKDIDFFRTIAFPGSLDISFENTNMTADEADIIALAKNLYWPQPFAYPKDKTLKDAAPGYMDAKRVVALMNIAHSSYASLAGMKAQAPKPEEDVEPGWAYMKTMLKDFGLPEAEIDELVGVRPSYWAQMDILTKKIYQNPNFYTNLYDKPINVERMSVALDAIKLMQMRDQFESNLRREMISSAMVETELEKEFKRAQTGLLDSNTR